MAWNEPGNNEKDPWKNKGGKNQGPPDLDDLLKDIGNKFGGIFGGGKSGGGSGKSFSSIGIMVVLSLCICRFLYD
jgi:membrane protease subunit HflK